MSAVKENAPRTAATVQSAKNLELPIYDSTNNPACQAMEKYISRTGARKTFPRYDIRTSQVLALREEMKINWFRAIALAYTYGVARGLSAGSKEKKA